MTKILFIAPTQGNGGIASWAANYRKNCLKDYELISIGVSKRRSQNQEAGILSRLFNGILDMFDTIHDIKRALHENNDIKIIHLTTSGKPGTLRDYFIVKTASKRGVKSIIHCHYGAVWSQIADNGFWGKLLRATFDMTDQIWVLDSKSQDALKKISTLKDKAMINPNFLEVPTLKHIQDKDYKNVAFVGNLLPSKGIYDLVKAVILLNNGTTLHIIGPGQPDVVKHIKKIAGDKLENCIKLYGMVPNSEAIDIIENMDIIALPTYYPCEAFPISILEAMSRGKMIIACDIGAISDMLTSVEGSKCGIIVKPQSPTDITDKLSWCQANMDEANCMCNKAYQKVHDVYRTEVVMELYSNCYKKLIKND